MTASNHTVWNAKVVLENVSGFYGIQNKLLLLLLYLCQMHNVTILLICCITIASRLIMNRFIYVYVCIWVCHSSCHNICSFLWVAISALPFNISNTMKRFSWLKRTGEKLSSNELHCHLDRKLLRVGTESLGNVQKESLLE